jgi:hypothetical protein
MEHAFEDIRICRYASANKTGTEQDTHPKHALFWTALFFLFLFGFESTQLARQLHQERTQMEVQ